MLIRGRGVLQNTDGATLCKADYSITLDAKLQGEAYTFDGDSPIQRVGKRKPHFVGIRPDRSLSDSELRGPLVLVTEDRGCFRVYITSSPLAVSLSGKATGMECPQATQSNEVSSGPQ
jgi:hypothetical protein